MPAAVVAQPPSLIRAITSSITDSRFIIFLFLVLKLRVTSFPQNLSFYPEKCWHSRKFWAKKCALQKLLVIPKALSHLSSLFASKAKRVERVAQLPPVLTLENMDTHS